MQGFVAPPQHIFERSPPPPYKNSKRILLPLLLILKNILLLLPKIVSHHTKKRAVHECGNMTRAYRSIRRVLFKDPKYDYDAYMKQFNENEDNSSSQYSDVLKENAYLNSSESNSMDLTYRNPYFTFSTGFVPSGKRDSKLSFDGYMPFIHSQEAFGTEPSISLFSSSGISSTQPTECPYYNSYR